MKLKLFYKVKNQIDKNGYIIPVWIFGKWSKNVFLAPAFFQ